jgi:hypothetical protein
MERFSRRPAAGFVHHRRVEVNLLNAAVVIGPDKPVIMNGTRMRLTELRRDPEYTPTHECDPFSAKVKVHRRRLARLLRNRMRLDGKGRISGLQPAIV